MDLKYVYLGYGADYAQKYNEEMARCNENVFNVSTVENRLSKFTYVISRIHLSSKINDFVSLPYRQYWLKWLIDDKTKKQLRLSDKIFFDISAWYICRFGLKRMYDYLHLRYPKCVVAVMFTDRVSLFARNIHNFDLREIKNTFDVVMTYNEVDAQEYGLKLTPSIVRDYRDVECSDYPKTDIFFVGQDKGRLGQIYDIYEKCTAHGLKCDFHLVGIEPSKQKYKDQISFGGYIPYEEVLRRSKAAKCILNIVQQGVKGITLRDYEAIGMNKLLMTNGEGLRDSDLYTEEKVIWLDDLENELWKFDKHDSKKEWNNKDKHTPEKYFEWIEELMNDKDKKRFV